MKKKILIILGFSALVFCIAGIYLITSIETATTKLNNLISLHQVEILREHLLIRIKAVQSDLYLMDTRFAAGTDAIVTDVTNMSGAIDVCFDCHHSPEVRNRLLNLQDHIRQYRDRISRVLTTRANTNRLEAEEEAVFRIGEEVTVEVKSMIALTTKTLNVKTAAAQDDIADTKRILFFLISVGPFLMAGVAFFFVKEFTRPVNSLLNATRKLKGGDLDYRVERLKDEFGEVAESFNEMASALKEQLHKVEVSEKSYRLLFEKAGDAIFILDAEGEKRLRIVAANQAAAGMHGYTVDELIGMKITDIDSDGAAVNAPALVQRMLRGEWISTEITHRKKDGTIFPVAVSAGLLELGDHKYILAFDRDVTARKHAEEALQRAEQLKVVGDLATGLTHELKNSLAGIKISIEVLLDELALSEDDRNVLSGMINEIRRIEILIKDLLNFARPSKPHVAFIDINSILDTAMVFSLKNVKRSADGETPVNVVKEFDRHLPKTVADPMQLQQVFMNLLLNAVEAMPKGGLLRVKTSHEAKTNMISVSIADTGKGVDKEVLDRIFEPFFTTKPKGTGLGLPITKRLVEQNGGDIHVELNAEKGTTFRISLPVKQFEEAGVA